MNPYEILDIDKTATDAEIKKAYRKLAAKHHPDKGGNEEQFKQINEAYSAINTPEKREQLNAPSGFGNLFGPFGDLFGDFFGNIQRTPPRPKTDNEIVFDFKISLAQIKNGLSQTLVYSRDIECDSCSGTGGENKRQCKSCDGRGFQVRRIGPIMQQVACRTCSGLGYTFDHRCTKCHGHGLIEIKESINLTIKGE